MVMCRLCYSDPCVLSYFLMYFQYIDTTLYISNVDFCIYIHIFAIYRTTMADAAIQAGDADSCRAPGLTSGILVAIYSLATVTANQFLYVFYIGTCICL